MLSVCLCVSPFINFWVSEPILIKLRIYIMAFQPINLSNQSVCLYLYPLIFARQRLNKKIRRAANAQARIQELLDAQFLCGPRSKIGKLSLCLTD
jgi:hypothetical protein